MIFIHGLFEAQTSEFFFKLVILQATRDFHHTIHIIC